MDTTPDWTGTHTFFSLSVSHFTHAHSAWLKMFQSEKSPRHRFMLTSISFLDVVAKHRSSMGRSFREKLCEPARRSGMSGRMADPAPNTGYEPNSSNFFSCTDPEHTPIDIPDSHQDFQLPGRRYLDLHH